LAVRTVLHLTLCRDGIFHRGNVVRFLEGLRIDLKQLDAEILAIELLA